MTREMVCISCPVGCRMVVEWEQSDGAVTVTGNRCAKGEEYGREEVLAPRRTVTATVLIGGSAIRRLPVKTDRPVAKELIADLLNELYDRTFDAPVRLGDVLIHDFRGTGVRVLATRTAERSTEEA